MVSSFPVKIPRHLKLSESQFTELVRVNPDLRLELTEFGELIVMAPTGSEGGSYNFELGIDLGNWNRRTGLGVAFDSSTGFRLPNGALRAPDLAWVSLARWQRLTPQERKGFAPLCPDFVLELASEADDISELQAKMQDYQANGCRLGWLMIPRSQQVEIYRPERPIEIQPLTTILSGEDVLPGFTLDLSTIF